jgi:uncharacterized protein with HEPN domain
VNDTDAANLLDMLTAERRVSSYISGKQYADLAAGGLLRDAVERQLEIVGEAARRVSPSCRQAHPEIPWTPVIAQRNVIAHEYGDIKLEWIWLVAKERIPELIAQLEALVPESPEGN